jgi:Fur family transcriptional regulator, peroxide stress response regulator
MDNNRQVSFDFQALKEKLSGHGLKVTSQRLVIYQSLLRRDDHPSAEIIFDRIRYDHPSISLATVYKTLDTLVASGLVKKVKTGDDLLRFDAKTENHSHLYCSSTNQIIDYEDDELHAILADYFTRKKLDNFKISDFQLQINGEIENKNKSFKQKQSK